MTFSLYLRNGFCSESEQPNLNPFHNRFRLFCSYRIPIYIAVQELHQAVVNTLKQSIKNAETQITINEKDAKNQLSYLEKKLNQKVFTQETLKRFEAKFHESEHTFSNMRNEIENLITKFNDFKVLQFSNFLHLHIINFQFRFLQLKTKIDASKVLMTFEKKRTQHHPICWI